MFTIALLEVSTLFTRTQRQLLTHNSAVCASRILIARASPSIVSSKIGVQLFAQLHRNRNQLLLLLQLYIVEYVEHCCLRHDNISIGALIRPATEEAIEPPSPPLPSESQSPLADTAC